MTIEQIEAAYCLKVELDLRIAYLSQALEAIQEGQLEEAHIALYAGGWTDHEPEDDRP
jgi:hypothetical protein